MCLRLGVCGLALVLMLVTGSCQAMTKTVAERCVLVDLQQERGRELLPLLEAFAKANALEPELSHPIAPRYIRGPKERSRAEIGYRIGMGEFGAALTLFRFDLAQDADLLEAFDRFVVNEVSPKYKVRLCADVPDYSIPVSIR